MLKRALITGASTGIGRALAEKMASKGVSVIAVARSEEKLKSLSQSNRNIEYIVSDLSCEDGRNYLITSVSGKLDYLINNAGIESHIGNIEELTESSLNEVLQTNLITPMIVTAKLKAKGCLSADSRILSTSSRAGDQAFRGVSAYCVSKTGVDAFTRALVEEGHLAATVVPGEVDTKIQKGLREATFPLQKFFIDAKNEGRLLSPEVSSNFLYYLLCEMNGSEFKGKKHNIYDTHYWKEWLGEGESLPTPAGERPQNMRSRLLDSELQ